ncbi:ABC transporter B member 11, partial [Dipsacomyces acuminosporus]
NLRQTLEKDISKSDDESDSDSNIVNSEIKAIPDTLDEREANLSVQPSDADESSANEAKNSSEDTSVFGTLHQRNDKKRSIATLLRLIGMNKRYALMFIPGAVLAIIDGAGFPCFSLVFSHILVAISNPNKEKQQHDVNFYSLLFLAFACVAFFAAGGRTLFFMRAGEHITYHVRCDVFRAMMRQDAAYFDKKENGAGALTARLATEAADINKCIGDAFPAFVAGVASVSAGVAIAFYYDWHLTIVILATLPFLTLAFFVEGTTVYASSVAMKGAYEKASQEAAETVASIRTVTTLTREHTFIQQFIDNSVKPYRNAIKNHYIGSLGYGFAQSILFFVLSMAFYVSSIFILNGYIDIQQMFNVLYAIIFASFALGFMAQQSSVLTKAVISSEKL